MALEIVLFLVTCFIMKKESTKQIWTVFKLWVYNACFCPHYNRILQNIFWQCSFIDNFVYVAILGFQFKNQRRKQMKESLPA
jgi:hypothetical protein